jgi:hypothetical protein
MVNGGRWIATHCNSRKRSGEAQLPQEYIKLGSRMKASLIPSAKGTKKLLTPNPLPLFSLDIIVEFHYVFMRSRYEHIKYHGKST